MLTLTPGVMTWSPSRSHGDGQTSRRSLKAVLKATVQHSRTHHAADSVIRTRFRSHWQPVHQSRFSSLVPSSVRRRHPQSKMVNMDSLLQSLAEDEKLSAALPSVQQVPSMGVEAAIASLKACVTSGIVGSHPELHRASVLAAACCCRLAVLAQRPGGDREATAGGAIAAIADAMRVHNTTPIMQAAGAEALALICLEEESAEDEGHPRLLARQTDAVPLIISAMLAYGEGNAELMQRGCMALSVIVGQNPAGSEQAVQLGARPDWLSLLS